MTTGIGAIVIFVLFWGASLLLQLLSALVVGVSGGWIVMLALGDLHTVWPAVPPLGYLASALSMWSVAFLGMALSRATTANTASSNRRGT